jgi:two-component system response regulator NreC
MFHTPVETAKISVVLADDHAILRQSLKMLLAISPDIEVVGEAQTGQETIEQALAWHPHVVVLDISMPDMDGFEACQEICERVPHTHILMLTMHENESYFLQALQAGAVGYLLKKAAPGELPLAIRAVSQGKAFFSPELLKALIQAYIARSHPRDSSPSEGHDGADLLHRLTPRQFQILKLIVQRQTNQDIADLLGISVKTVQAHRASVMERLGLRNMAHLVRFAIRHDLLPLEDAPT